jgi:hypothetical protein
MQPPNVGEALEGQVLDDCNEVVPLLLAIGAELHVGIYTETVVHYFEDVKVADGVPTVLRD